jgi:uncharacterized protein YegL
VITFAARAQQVVPLTDIVKLTLPALRVRPGTALGAALSLLMTCIEREVRPNAPERKGDWRPLIFLLSDGDSTDSWEEPVRRWKSFQASHRANLIAVACGPDANARLLKTITETVVLMRGTTPEDFKRFFAWVSASTRRLSVDARSEARGGSAALPPLPADVLELAREEAAVAPQRAQRLVFLPARCSGSRKPYLIRYRLVEGGEHYEAVQAHQVDSEYFSEPAEPGGLTTINLSKLYGAPSCPYCGNTYCVWDAGMTIALCSPPVEIEPWRGDVSAGRG